MVSPRSERLPVGPPTAALGPRAGGVEAQPKVEAMDDRLASQRRLGRACVSSADGAALLLVRYPHLVPINAAIGR